MIFDQVFLDLTVRRQRSMMYRNGEKLLQKNKVNDFRPYRALLLTCSELNKEVKEHWDKYYLHRCCVYFWHVSKLYDLAQMLDKKGQPFAEIKYVLRSQCAAPENVNTFCLLSTVAEVGTHEAEWFIETQPGISPGYPEDLKRYFTQRLFPTAVNDFGAIEVEEGTYEATEDIPVRVVVHKEAGETFARAECRGPDSCAVSGHRNETVTKGGGFRTDEYAEMQGKFSGIFWGGYDAAIGYAKLKLWKTTPLRHLEGRCRCREWSDPENRYAEHKLLRYDERERLKLLSKWYNKITVDRKWLALGGQADEEQGLSGLLGEYGMEYWLDEEHWSVEVENHWESFENTDWEWEEIEDFRRLTAAEELLERQY